MDGRYCRLHHILTNSFFHTSQSTLKELDEHTFAQCVSKADVDDDLFDEKLNVNFRPKVTFEDVFEITRVDEDDVDDFNVVFSLRPNLELAVQATSWPASKHLPSQAYRRRGGGADEEEDGGFGFEAADAAVFPLAGSSLPSLPPSQAHWDQNGKRLIDRGAEIAEMLAEFLLDEDDDDDDWGKSRYKRQGLLQDLGVLDQLCKLISGPIEHLPERDLRKDGFPELANGASTGVVEGLWEHVFMALKNSAEGDETSTDRYIARHHKVFLKHSMYLKTEGAAEVLVELFQDNRDVLDDLLDSEESFNWIINHLDATEQAHQDFIDHDFYDFLAATCVCKGLAVQRAQAGIYNKIHTLGDSLFKNGHFYKLSLEVVGLSTHKSSVHAKAGHKSIATELRVQFNMSEPPMPLKSLCEEILATQPKDVQTYYGAKPSQDLRVKMLGSNLNFCAQLCQGHSRQQVAFVESVAPKDALFALLTHTQLPYDIRAKAVQLLFEVHLDTAGALAVLSGSRKDGVLPWSRSNGRETAHTLNEARALNIETGRIETTSYAPLNQVRKAYAAELHQWVVAKQTGHGFQTDLKAFTMEMQRIIRDSDEFEEWHDEHGVFVIEVLQSLHLLIESGYYQEWALVKDVLAVLVQDLVVFAPALINDKVATNQKDMQRDALISQVFEKALMIVELVQAYQMKCSVNAFFDDYYDLTEWKEHRGQAPKKALVRDLKGIAVLFEENEKLEDWEVEFRDRDREAVIKYLKQHFAAFGLDELTDIKALFHSHSPPTSMNTVLMDIVTRGKPQEYDDYNSNIVKHAMKLLNMQFSCEVALFRTCVDVRIVSSEASMRVYALVDQVLPQLQYLIEDTQIDEKEAKTITWLVEQLIQGVLYEGEPCFAWQEIMIKRNVLTVVLSVFDQELDDNDLEGDGKETDLEKALCTCLRLIMHLTRGQEQACERMIDEMPNLLTSENTECLRVTTALARCLSEIFGNPKYQMKVRENHLDLIFKRMFDLYEDKIYCAALLDLLRSTAQTTEGGSASMTRNQGLIAAGLMQHESNILGALHSNDLPKLKSILDSPNVEDLSYQFHIALVELLAMLGEGQNKFIEGICKKIFSMETLLQVLTIDHIRNTPRTFQAYASFLHDIYLSDNSMLDLAHTRPLVGDYRMWDVVTHCVKEIARLGKQPLTKHSAGYVFNVLVPLLLAFFKKEYQPKRLGGSLTSNPRMSMSSGAPDTQSLQSFNEGAEDVRTWSNAQATEACGRVAVDLLQEMVSFIFSHSASPYWTTDTHTKASALLMATLRNATLSDRQVNGVFRHVLAQSPLRNRPEDDILNVGLDELKTEIARSGSATTRYLGLGAWLAMGASVFATVHMQPILVCYKGKGKRGGQLRRLGTRANILDGGVCANSAPCGCF